MNIEYFEIDFSINKKYDSLSTVPVYFFTHFKTRFRMVVILDFEYDVVTIKIVLYT